MSLKLKMNAKLQIIRPEGFSLEDSSLGCYVVVDQELVDVVTPLKINDSDSPDIPTTSIPSQGELKLVVKRMNGNSVYLGSVSVNIESLPSKGFLWLGTSQDIDNDFFPILKDLNSEKKLLISIEKPSNSVNSSSLYQLQLKKFEFLTSQFEERLAETNEFYEHEKKERVSLASAYELLQRQLEEQVKKAQQRENSMLTLIEKKDQDLQESFSKFKDLRNRYQSIKIENKQLAEQLEMIKNASSISVVEKYSAELEELKKMIKNIELKNKNRQKQVNDLGKDWLQALKCLGINKVVKEEDLQCIEKVEEFRLKAQILELQEKNTSLSEKLRKVENEKNLLNLKLLETQTCKSPDKENKSQVLTANNQLF
jgi:hypothetical protein